MKWLLLFYFNVDSMSILGRKFVHFLCSVQIAYVHIFFIP